MPRAQWIACLIGLLACGVASAAAPTSAQERACVEYGERMNAAPAPHSKEVQPPSVIKLEYPDLRGTTPAHYPWPMRLDVLVDAEGKVRRVCTLQDQRVLATFGDAISRGTFRPARLRGQPVAFETPMTIHLPELERARE